MTWTLFWDMNSGGGLKEPWQFIYIEAAEQDAREIFYKTFRHYPDNVTCQCCGEDYSVSEYPTLDQATGYHRGCKTTEDGQYIDAPAEGPYRMHKYCTLADYVARPDVLLIHAK